MYYGALDVAEAILFGVIQGILEWLPVSSSGQLTIFYTKAFGLDPIYAYRLSLASHLGTTLSAIIYYRNTLARITREKVWLKIMAIPTLTALPVGYLLYNYIVGVDPVLLEASIGLFLIITGVVLNLRSQGKVRSIVKVRVRELILAGLLEGFSVVPGISRSAVTISALAIRGYRAIDSVKASFLMAIPVTLIASLYEAFELMNTRSTAIDLAGFAIILVSSFIAGLASIKFMMEIAGRLSSKVSLFLIILGLIILALYMPMLA